MESQLPSSLCAAMQQSGVIAVLVIDEVEHAVPLAQALLAGGVTTMELTLRTAAALPALAEIREQVPEMLAGIGTILTAEQVERVVEAGAAFGVAPGTNPRIVEKAQGLGLPFAPGVATPSDIEAALELGCRELKFFPAEPSGGLAYLKTMAAPYRHLGVRFMPLGGIHAATAPAYLGDPLILAVGGSWLAPRPFIQAGNWEGITRLAQEAAAICEQARTPAE